MYASISGIIEAKQANCVIINNNGIGYEIFVSNNTLSNLGNIGQQAKLYTYLHVREDAFNLYGFITLQEKQLFLDLMNVSGIGAKMAITILSGVSINSLINAITTGDVKLLSSIKGVGKKTAERIVLELRGGLTDSELSELLSEEPTSTPVNEAIEVLIGMGLQKQMATNLVKSVALPTDTAEKIIEKCLKSM